MTINISIETNYETVFDVLSFKKRNEILSVCKSFDLCTFIGLIKVVIIDSLFP